MVGEDESPRRRDVLRTGAAAGLLGFAGLTMNGASAQETTPEQETTTPEQETTPADTQQAGAFSISLQQGDQFRVRFAPRSPFGEPATETIPAGCLDGESSQEYQLLIVRAFRSDTDLGFRSLMVPQEVVEFETGETTPETTPEETPKTTPETTPTAVAGVPTIEQGEWYRVTSSEQCDGLFALEVETMETPQTTPSGGQTTTPGN